MRRGHCRLRRANAGLHPPIKDAKDAIRAHDRSRRFAKGLSGAVARLERGAAQHLAAGDFVLRRQSQPGTEVFFVGEFAHIRACLHDNLLSEDFAHAMNGGHVHAADALEMLADGAPFGSVLAVTLALVFGDLTRRVVIVRAIFVGANGVVHALDLGVAGFDLACVEVIHLQRLLEDEEMLFAPGAGQGFSDLVFVFATAIIAQAASLYGSHSPATMARMIA